MVRPHSPVPKEKCRLCRLGIPCPEHGSPDEVEERRARAAEVRRSKSARRAAKGGGKGG